MANTDFRDIGTALYATARSHGPDKLFQQEDFLSFGIVPGNDVELLANSINWLTGEGLVKLMTKDGRSCFKAVPRDDAAKYRSLSQDEALVFSYIESSGREGIWVKVIRSKSNLHQAPLNKCLKTLEQKGLIKQLHSQRAPGRRTYMLSSLQPLEEVSGGPFYAEGMLDDAFVHHSCRWLEVDIIEKSWHRLSRRSGKRKRITLTEEEDESYRKSERSAEPTASRSYYLPMPPGFQGYPTVSDLTQSFNKSTMSSVKLKEDEVRQLLDILCWDGKIEKVLGGKAFRSTKPDSSDNPNTSSPNMFTEAPCGRCPVLDLCDGNGPVNARTCPYFSHWLGA